MKKRKIQQAILFLLFSCICFCGCDNEKEKQPEDAKMSYIQLCMPQAIQVETKVVPADVPKLGDIPVYNVWIVQFKLENGKAGSCLKALYVPQSGISQSTNPATDLVVNLTTGGVSESIAKFSVIESRFYVIANGGISLLTSSPSSGNMQELGELERNALTEDILKAKTVNVGSVESNPFITDPPSLLTSEPFDYTPGEDGKIKIRTQMFRAFAKVTVKITSLSPGLFTTDGGSAGRGNVKIYNLPKKMAVYRAGGGKTNNAYPLAADIAGGAFNLDIGQLAVGNESMRTVTATFYMAENLRGIGTSTTQQGKNLDKNGPGSDPVKLTGCTYIVLEGTYKYDPAHTAGVKVKYTFYLGGNFTNDYNIARDYSYDLTFRIAGPNSADVRVDITDGNVAVFDEVVVKPDITVEF